MPLAPEDRLRFFVYVVESPSAVDLYHGRREGEIIKQAASLNQVPSLVKTAINYEAFEASLKIGLKEAMEQFPGLIPMLHISAHGFDGGIGLSSGQIVEWGMLESLLRPINQAFSNTLLLCLSCCHGYSGIKMAMNLDEQDHPFFAIVSNPKNPLWSDTAVAYSTFYHLIAKGYSIVDAVRAMRVASGNDCFWIRAAEDVKNGYLEYIHNLNPDDIQDQLEENIQREDPDHLAKLVKASREQP